MYKRQPLTFRRSRNLDIALAVVNSPIESKPVSGPSNLNIFVLLLSLIHILSILACWVRYFTTKKNCAANHDTELDAK